MQQRLADLKSGMIQSTSTTGGLGGLDGVLRKWARTISSHEDQPLAVTEGCLR